MKKNLCLAALLSLCFGQSAVAGLWTEAGDAGGTPLTAQLLTGNGVLNTIQGNINDPADTDVFRVYIDNPATFSITMTGTALTGDNDTALYVLDTLGNIMFANDDLDNNNLLSQLNAGQFASNLPGFYLVAYNTYLSYAIKDDGVEFDVNHLPPLPIHITGWRVEVSEDSQQTGPVQLNFTGARFDAPPPPTVPEPVSLTLTMLGLAGLGFSRHRAMI